MRPTRLASDKKKLEQDPGTYPFGKNGIWDANAGAEQNEKGFRPSSASWPYKYIGVIETDTFPVIFTTDNINSAAGYWDVNKDIYVPIFDDSTMSFKFGFNLDHPIKGEARRNYKNEIELTWLELGENTNPPRWLNTVRLGNDLNDFLLFPESQTPNISLSMQAGGNLGMGAYFIALKYIKKDGTETRYTTLTAPLIAVSDNWSTVGGGNTGQALVINITNADTTYDRVGLVVVERINGVDTPYELPELNVAANINFIYTGSEKQTQITMEEVLIPAAYYTNAKAITQLNDRLYLGNMTEEADIDWQKYATLVKVRWNSTLVNSVPRNTSVTSGKLRGWMHEEVYCLMMVLKLKNGRNSRAFVLAGPKPISSDLTASPLGTAQGLTGKKYQIEDTVRNVTGNTGDCGIWLNENETYPDTDQFDSTDVGGENLRGQPVRHFKMPSVAFCKSNLYAGTLSYGREQLDVLGLSVSNVIIPPELATKVLGWELHYAKRDFNNATVLGQSTLLFGAQGQEDKVTNNNIVSTGGNWGSYTPTHGAPKNSTNGGNETSHSLFVKQNHIRFHAFDLLNFRPSVSATHLSLQLDMVIRNKNGFVGLSNSNQVIYNLDYTTPDLADGGKIVADSLRIRKLDKGQYILDGQVTGDYINTRQEDAFVGVLPSPGTLMSSAQWTWAKRDYSKDNNNTHPQFEQTWLTNLMTIRRNVYVNFYSQILVRTGYTFDAALQASSEVIYGGDTFVSYYQFNGYGLVTKKDVIDDTGETGWKTLATDGIKVSRLFTCETVADLAGRYEIPGNTYSKFYPKSLLTYLKDFSRNINPNQFGYTKDTNAVGDLLNGIRIASPLDDFVLRSPYKITRSTKQVREGKINSWKNFNALDYYETAKDKGEITNLQGYNDNLIIHHSEAFTITRDKATLSTDILNVTLGTGDIFQFEPQEGRPSKLGYAGTSNPLACVMTPAGYLFPDTRTGELFIFNGKLLLLGMDLTNLLLKYLTVKEINTFIGNGITIGYEQYYNRLLITCKNIKLSTSELVYVAGYTPTPEFIATLTPNISVVYKDGRFQLYKGLNSSVYACTVDPLPTLPDYNFNSPEQVAAGTVIGTIVATGGVAPYNYLITTIDKAGLAVNSLNGQVYVIDAAAFLATRSVLHLDSQVTDFAGNVDAGSIDVTITPVESTPVVPNYSKTIPEHSANGTVVVDVDATDADGKAISYSITAGNDLGAFAINAATGIITVANTALLEFDTNPTFLLTVRATAGTKHADGSVNITLSYVFTPPVQANVVYTIIDTLVAGSVVGTLPLATQDSSDSGELVYRLVSDSAIAGAFSVGIDPDAEDYRKVKVLDNSKLDPANSPYVVTMSVESTQASDMKTNFTITITVLYDPATLSGEPYQYVCNYPA